MIVKQTPMNNSNCPPVAYVVAGLHSPSRRAILIDVLFTPAVTKEHVPTADSKAREARKAMIVLQNDRAVNNTMIANIR